MSVNIAIDGPSGAGKSSAAKLLAKKLGYLYIDTGALYRAVGLFCIRAGVANLSDENRIVPLLADISVELKFMDGTQHVFLNGEDVSGEIRTQPVAKAASEVSALVPVRHFLLELQREIAAKNDVIMDGRDIGTVILPHADVKFFLTADSRSRALRRVSELAEKGIEADLDTVQREIEQRDKNDSTRAAAPLKQADDAMLVDNSGMDLEQTAEFLQQIITERLK